MSEMLTDTLLIVVFLCFCCNIYSSFQWHLCAEHRLQHQAIFVTKYLRLDIITDIVLIIEVNVWTVLPVRSAQFRLVMLVGSCRAMQCFKVLNLRKVSELLIFFPL